MFGGDELEGFLSFAPKTAGILIGLSFTVPVVTAMISRFLIRVVAECRR